MRHFVLLLAGLVLAVLDTPPAEAQTAAARPLAVGVTVGGAVPLTGTDAGEEISSGAHVSVWGQVRPGSFPLYVMLEGGAAVFPTSRMSQLIVEEPRLRPSELGIASITTNLVLGDIQQGTVRPFLVGGVGYYYLMAETLPNPYGGYSQIEIRPSESGFGLNGGGGAAFSLRIPRWTRLDCSATARYHSVYSSGSHTVFVPIAFSARLY